MLQIRALRKYLGGRQLFDGAELRILSGDRLGLVGPNGIGKTTLLRMIAGEDFPDAGQVQLEGKRTVGYLPQEAVRPSSRPLLEEVTAHAGGLKALEAKMRAMEEDIHGAAGDEALTARLTEEYGRLQHHFEALRGYDLEFEAGRVLTGLGFKAGDFGKSVDTFSGGWRMRAELARLLLAAPDLLLLDEPTNHLDLASLEWLEEFLFSYDGGILLISHDRPFLNRVTNETVEIDGGKLVAYAGGYDRYLAAREQRKTIAEAAARNQAAKVAQIERFVERFRAKNTKATQVQSRIKMLEKMERVEVVSDAAPISFSFPQPERSGEEVMRLRGVDKSYGPTVVYTGVDFVVHRAEKVAFVGPNGAGKSTLLKILAGVLPIDDGSREPGYKVEVGYYAQHQLELLQPANTALQELFIVAPTESETRLRTLLGCFLFRGDDVHKKVQVLSGGEKARLALAKMLLKPANFLLLDEPTNHLDIPSRDVLEDALAQYTGTLCFITHDRHLIDAVATKVLEVDAGQLTYRLGGYSEFERIRAQRRAPADPSAQPAEAEGGGYRTRDQRRKDAEERAERRRRTAPLRSAIEKIEADMEELTLREKELSDRIADPALYSDASAIAEVTREYQRTRKRIEELTYEWELKSLEMEAMEGEA
ncbi:MAG: ABC-F family ATP-binding cassette domain-containing protein [Candidatus Wallbacteria bacterium]|nr:ABC-F family ATP-binding cassette domain-containing protein [Candidatus Wallbacteria bacterium]